MDGCELTDREQILAANTGRFAGAITGLLVDLAVQTKALLTLLEERQIVSHDEFLAHLDRYRTEHEEEIRENVRRQIREALMDATADHPDSP